MHNVKRTCADNRHALTAALRGISARLSSVPLQFRFRHPPRTPADSRADFSFFILHFSFVMSVASPT
jgi:hypothetical protein